MLSVGNIEAKVCINIKLDNIREECKQVANKMTTRGS